MERKFKLKLVPVKASEVRKQAIVHLKETIELVFRLKISKNFFFKLN